MDSRKESIAEKEGTMDKTGEGSSPAGLVFLVRWNHIATWLFPSFSGYRESLSHQHVENSGRRRLTHVVIAPGWVKIQVATVR
jgi:hypothetical protein